MWATLALATALNLAPAQSGSLRLKNDRVIYGALGQERKDSKILGGDLFVVAFDIEGLKVAENGLVKYSMSLDVINKEGKSQFRQDPQDLEAYNALGGGRVPGVAHVFIGNDQPEGEYTLKVTVKDRATDQSDTLVRKFEVVQHRFGFVQIGLSYQTLSRDVALAAPPLGVPGQTLMLSFSVVGFELDKSRKDQPLIETSLRVLDEDGKQTLAKPYGGLANEVPAEYKKGVPMSFTISLNRPGKFKLVLSAADKVGGKTAEQTLDLTVIEQK
jgi:hypothetical protein